jgi:PKD repeat protein
VIHHFPESSEYRVHLIVENPYDDARLTLKVGAGNPVTEASFDYSPTVPEVTTPIQFTADHSPGDATTPITYTWNFGDNTTLETTALNASHSYSAGGFYNVKLTANNGYGIAVHNHVIEVKEGVSNVSFTHDPSSPLDGDVVTFSAAFEPTTASQPIYYTWDFGDGSDPIHTIAPSIAYVFTGVGVYTVELTAFNGYGESATHSAAVAIDGRALSDVTFHLAQTQSQNEFETTLHATHSPSLATQPVTYTWDFDDGTTLTTTDESVTHEFAPPSTPYTYTVQLTATNGWGPAVTDSRPVRLPFDDDGDGLTNNEEFDIGSDPQNPDTDGDSLWDGREVNGYVYAGYPPHTDYGQHINTDPLDADTDDDLLFDGSELGYGSHPRDPDTDDDALLDGEEPGIAGTPNPLDPDSDDDSLLDGAEVKASFTDPLDPDSDGDSIPDPIEVDEDNDPDNALDPANHPDTDNDGILDAWDSDSDADGISDTAEWSTDPDDLLVGCKDAGSPICINNNVDGDARDNYRDRDTDNDCALDMHEFDMDGDGIPDDSNSDGIPNWLESGICTYLPVVLKQYP